MKKITVIIADAGDVFRTMLADAIGASGEIEVLGITGNGADALMLVKLKKPDVLVTDVILSGIDGIAMLERLREMSGRKPAVLVLSAFSGEHLCTKAAKLGAEYFLPKPCDVGTLVSRITMLAEKPHAESHRREASVEKLATDAVRAYGVPAKVSGFRYLREAVVIAVNDVDILNAVTKELYPAVAEKFGTSVSAVERGIRHAIEIAWQRRTARESVFTAEQHTKRPSNTEFIATVADGIRFKREENAK